MSLKTSEPAKKENRTRVFHWIITSVFFVLFISGTVLFTPLLSKFAANSWTRLIHRIFALTLIVAIIFYTIINYRNASQWLKNLAFWTKSSDVNPDTWKRKHKALVIIGIATLIVTGSIQWFLKGIISIQVFMISIMIHDIAFFYVFVVLLFHLYHEFDWWLWKKRYCSRCHSAACAGICPVGSISIAYNQMVARDDKCNNCRLCMKDCQRHSFYAKTTTSH